MTKPRRRRVQACALGALLLAFIDTAAAGGTVVPGDTIARLTLEDQHGAPALVDEHVRVLVLSKDMQAGDVVKQTLADVDQRFLDERDLVYLADISGMPTLVSKLFALPRLRERRYRVVLDRDGTASRAVPVEKGKPTVLFLERLRVLRVLQPATVEELKAALAPAPEPAR